MTQRQFLERFAAGLGVPARWIPVPHALAWGGARLWDATVGALAGWTGLLSARSSVQFLASVNPYTSARAERVLGWRPVVPAPEAVERTGRVLPRAPTYPLKTRRPGAGSGSSRVEEDRAYMPFFFAGAIAFFAGAGASAFFIVSVIAGELHRVGHGRSRRGCRGLRRRWGRLFLLRARHETEHRNCQEHALHRISF